MILLLNPFLELWYRASIGLLAFDNRIGIQSEEQAVADNMDELRSLEGASPSFHVSKLSTVLFHTWTLILDYFLTGLVEHHSFRITYRTNKGG